MAHHAPRPPSYRSTQVARDIAAQSPGQVARNDGDHEKALQAGGKTLESIYQVPYLEHACMEPMNATAQPARAIHLR